MPRKLTIGCLLAACLWTTSASAMVLTPTVHDWSFCLGDCTIGLVEYQMAAGEPPHTWVFLGKTGFATPHTAWQVIALAVSTLVAATIGFVCWPRRRQPDGDPA